MKKAFHFDAPREKYHCDAAMPSVSIIVHLMAGDMNSAGRARETLCTSVPKVSRESE